LRIFNHPGRIVMRRSALYVTPLRIAFLSAFVSAQVSAATVFINEIHYDNAGTDAGEAIEVAGPAGTDLSGWSLVLYNGTGGAVYDTDMLSGTIPDLGGGYGVVVQNYPVNGIQNGSPDGIALIDAGNNLVQFLSYEGVFTAVGGAANGMSGIDIGVSEAASTATGFSLQLTGSGSESQNFTWTAPAAASFGAINTGQTLGGTGGGSGGGGGGGVMLVPIPMIQGGSDNSPMVGATVTIEGVVTGDFQDGAGTHGDLNGFFVQDTGDGNAATSDGIFVFDGDLPSIGVNAGDRVRVTGIVAEYFGETQITATGASTSVAIIGSGSVAPTDIALPASGVTNNADGKPIANLERYEGMLVRFPQPLVVSELFNLDRFGELRLVEGARAEQFTMSNAPSQSGYPTHVAELARRTLMLDDGLVIQNPNPIRYPAPGLSTAIAMRMGDTLTNLTGNLHFSRGSGGSGDETYRLMPTVEPSFVAVNTRPSIPVLGGSLRVASFNVLNFFNDLADGTGSCFPSGTSSDCRGASNPSEYARQLQKTVTALAQIDADIYGLIEIENDYPDAENSSIDDLVDALNAASTRCAGQYDYVALPGNARLGGDAIAVGLVYCTASVTLAPGTSPALLDDSDLPALGLSGPVFTGESTSRAPLAASFRATATGETFTVVVNHFKSKSGPGALTTCSDPLSDPNCDQSDGQGYWNARRIDAAQALHAWLGTHPTGSSDSDVLIIGDLNSYRQEGPLVYLTGQGYSNLNTMFAGSATPYSYVFDGQTGTLDYALANASLNTQVAAVTEWHINADEADGLDYNLDFGRSAATFDGTVAFRASDHDPVLVDLNLASMNNIVGTPQRDMLNGSTGNDRITGLQAADRITTDGGMDILVYTRSVDGGDTVTDFSVGSDRIDLSQLLNSLGYNGSDPLADGVVTIVTRGTGAQLFIDADGNGGPATARSYILLQNTSAATLNSTANFIF
jgi:predicted extracellular nuclease